MPNTKAFFRVNPDMTERFPTHAPGLPEPSKFLTRFIPAIVYPGLLLSMFVYYPFWYFMKDKEGGIEWIMIVFLLIGIGHGVNLLARYRSALPRPWLVWWFVLSTFGMVVFAGEEISWGQHLGLWTGEDLPEALRAMNDQDESNFHNMTNALDQGPTNVIVAGTFFAYVLLPILQRHKRETMTFDNPGYWFWPTRAGLFAGIGVLIIPFPKRIYEWTTGVEGPFDLRHSEIQEFYIGLLMTTYIVSVHHRLRALALQKSESASAPAGSNQ